VPLRNRLRSTLAAGSNTKHLQPIFRDFRDHVLLCCTERNTSADIDAFVAALAESL